MGCRVVYYIEGAPCAVYGHEIGEKSIDLLKAALPTMRKSDNRYATARLIGHLCKETQNSAPHGIGVLDPPKPKDVKDNYSGYSHGDAGVIIINKDLTRATFFAGVWVDSFPDGMELSGASDD